jgi:hypothetical protein
MTMPFRTITAAGVAAVALAGGAALTGSTAQADEGGTTPRLPARPAERALVSACSGGANVAMFSRSMDSQSVAAGTSTDVEGSQWLPRGPRRGTDTVLVTLTTMASSGGSGELTSVALYKDGVGRGTKYLTYNGALDQAGVQFCTKISRGQHSLSLKVTDSGGSASTLYFPTVTYQRFN